jgi:excisionase family DNA binding protein
MKPENQEFHAGGAPACGEGARMKTLNLEQAAALLHMHKYTVMQKVHAGAIPAAKPGKRWVFIEDDLLAYLRGQYRPVQSAPSMRSDAPVLVSSPANLEKQYLNALGLSDCPQIHSPRPAARSGASHAHAARRVA